jgi:hypothetical protein
MESKRRKNSMENDTVDINDEYPVMVGKQQARFYVNLKSVPVTKDSIDIALPSVTNCKRFICGKVRVKNGKVMSLYVSRPGGRRSFRDKECPALGNEVYTVYGDRAHVKRIVIR